MVIKAINSHDELKKLLKTNEHVYCLIYKSDSDISACANDKLQLAASKNEDGILCTVDVASVRDIHTHYNVSTAPTLLVFENGKTNNQVKGCNDVSFYENLMQGKYFVSNTADTAGKKSVTVYTTPTCTYCNSLKSYLRTHQISFREIDISRDSSQAEALVRRTGQQGVPQTNINGTFVVGFDQKKINELLNIKN